MSDQVQRCFKLVDFVLGGAEDYDLLLLRDKTITERNEFNSLVSEFKKESLPMRIHQVCGNNPTVVVMFQWVLAYCDRYSDLVQCWCEFVEYTKKNQFGLTFGLDRSLIFQMQVFEYMYIQVLEHRKKQAA